MQKAVSGFVSQRCEDSAFRWLSSIFIRGLGDNYLLHALRTEFCEAENAVRKVFVGRSDSEALFDEPVNPNRSGSSRIERGGAKFVQAGVLDFLVLVIRSFCERPASRPV